ncbi:MAG: hypothetical protein AAGF44_08505 [Pseudomonadota bacterium]
MRQVGGVAGGVAATLPNPVAPKQPGIGFRRGFGGHRVPLIFANPYLSDWERRRLRVRRQSLPPAPPDWIPPVSPPERLDQAEPEVLDPLGPRFAPARVRQRAEITWTTGDVLPPRLVIVTLDWRRYDLERPAPGALYARVGRQVLLIDAARRVVLSPVAPG